MDSEPLPHRRIGGYSEASPLRKVRPQVVPHSEASPLRRVRLQSSSEISPRHSWSTAPRRGSIGSDSSSTSTTYTTESDDEEDSDYDLLEALRPGTSPIKESDSDMVDDSRSNAGEVHMHSLVTTTWKEVFNIVSSKYHDDTLSANGNVAISNANQLGLELIHTPGVAYSTVQFEPLFRWIITPENFQA
ncbi:hypothetical protein DL765_010346 [Monosporascus sp. GIB2]|nr:hypothetical protein DL765_010346 [Monosporascus sp. GIB2]